MPAIKDQAIALRRLDYSETSQVLLFLTRDHGPRRLLAKGIKRSTKTKPAAGIDLLEHGQLEFSARSSGDSTLGILMEWRQINLYLGLRAGLDRLYAAQYAAEITAGMAEESDPHPELFDALIGTLEALVNGGQPLPLLTSYQAALLSAVGLWPDLSRCMLCDRQAPPGRAGYFSAQQGGLICRDCVNRIPEKIKASAGTLDALRQGSFTEASASAAFDFLDHTITHALGRRPELTRFVRSLTHPL